MATNKTPPADLTEMILEAISEGVFTVDPDMNITSFNRAAQEITGVPVERALGRKCHEVFRAAICDGQCPLKESISTGRPSEEAEVEITNANGSAVPLRVRAAALRDADGRLQGGVETFRDVSTERHLVKRITEAYTFCDIKGKSEPMTRLFSIMPDVAASNSTVLITGESGTGKELVARALHDLSSRHEGPFVAVNCGSIPETLMESELFGHLRGAFTGAERERQGRFAAAKGGTLFLDEIAEMPITVQAKLLRALDQGEYTPLGANMPLKAKVRVLAATNRDLEREAAEGRFRQDLYYRLNVLHLSMPPLRDRREDIPVLVDYFLERLAAERGEDRSEIGSAAMGLLLEHNWPGNVRELQNALEHAVVLARGGRVEPRHLPESLRRRLRPQVEPVKAAADLDLGHREQNAIRRALTMHKGHRAKAAAELGISTTTLWRKIKRYGMEADFN